MARASNELASYTLVFFHDTDRAWLVGNDGDRDKAFWLPKSQVEFDAWRQGREEETVGGVKYNPPRYCRIISLSIPAWLAEERGLV